MARFFKAALLAGLLAGPAWSQEVPPNIEAKILKVLAASLEGGTPSVYCRSFELKKDCILLGVPLNDGGSLVWVTNPADAKAAAQQGRLGICGSLDLLAAGAALAIVSEGGRPTIYVNPGNLARSQAKLSDSVMKIAKVAK